MNRVSKPQVASGVNLMWKKKSTWNLSLMSKNIWVYACWGMVVGSTSYSSSFGFFFFSSSSIYFLLTLYGTRVLETQVPHGLFIHISLKLESLRLEFLHWTRASKAQDVSLLKCFKNMSINEIVTRIMFNDKFPRKY